MAPILHRVFVRKKSNDANRRLSRAHVIRRMRYKCCHHAAAAVDDDEGRTAVRLQCSCGDLTSKPQAPFVGLLPTQASVPSIISEREGKGDSHGGMVELLAGLHQLGSGSS